ncbi:hypothetical protein DUI87_21786 [Hirundo rustica rustica]|uniref:Uncharacterized protein n=1 Tax=Hirundo rustica rustica TaxID=333673 RepID=A0A3M0JL11_HIRRU|nr:hypothetical protein DUI87_21786 [Hirundo rustica rustica]
MMGMKHRAWKTTGHAVIPGEATWPPHNVAPVPAAPQILHKVVQLGLPALLCLSVGLSFLLSKILMEKLGSTGSSLSSCVPSAGPFPMARISQGHQFIMESLSSSPGAALGPPLDSLQQLHVLLLLDPELKVITT